MLVQANTDYESSRRGGRTLAWFARHFTPLESLMVLLGVIGSLGSVLSDHGMTAGWTQIYSQQP
jgi:hypothetical protein